MVSTLNEARQFAVGVMRFNQGNEMKLKFLFVIAPVCIAACSTVGNYKPLEDGQYLVTVYSNAFSNSKKIQAEFDEEASKACNGGEFHYVETRRAQIKNTTTYGSAYNTSNNVLQNARVVACGSKPVSE